MWGWSCCPICGNEAYSEWDCIEKGIKIEEVDSICNGECYDDYVTKLKCCHCGYIGETGEFTEFWEGIAFWEVGE